MSIPMLTDVKTSPAVYFLLSTFWARGYASVMGFAFEKLQVYQKVVSFADAVCTLTQGFPRGYFFLADQLNRAALSIAANIAEGNGRFTKPDRRKLLRHRPWQRAGMRATAGIGQPTEASRAHETSADEGPTSKKSPACSRA
jgi:hypothetical protein